MMMMMMMKGSNPRGQDTSRPTKPFTCRGRYIGSCPPLREVIINQQWRGDKRHRHEAGLLKSIGCKNLSLLRWDSLFKPLNLSSAKMFIVAELICVVYVSNSRIGKEIFQFLICSAFNPTPNLMCQAEFSFEFTTLNSAINIWAKKGGRWSKSYYADK